MSDFQLNYRNIPPLAIGFTRSSTLMGKAIQFFRGILKDGGAPNHAFIVTSDHGQLFATEETLSGLEERSMERYTSKKERIVAMYYWLGWDEYDKGNIAETFLAEIRRKMGETSKYDFWGLLSFVPVLKKFFKPDPKRQWCSENCASVMKFFGADFIRDTKVTPDQLLAIMQHTDECKSILGYYK